jgi:hypothetical protein
MTRNMRRVLGAVLLLCGAVLAGCNERPAEVDRVQTNLVDKAIFEGEWWYTATTVDVDYDEAFVFSSANGFAPFEGSMSTDYGLDFNRGGPEVLGSPTYSFPIARIRWVIDEKFLFAYRSFELVSGGNVDGRSPDFRGQPLAVYAIDDHVDVRSGYSAITGQKDNVKEENDTDRRWFERAFMRVDWSQNLLTEFAANAAQESALFTSFQREPVPFFFQEGGQQQFPESYKPSFVRVEDDASYRFADEWPTKERDRVHYMSFVNQEVWSPSGSCLEQGGVCASVTATMRHSFLRVPPGHEYATRTSTHSEFDRFGIFRSHQPTYARGGEDKSVQRKHCATDADCGVGGACDNLARVQASCSDDACPEPTYNCIGGLTSDQGETDFLSFYASRHNLYSDSLTEQSCVADWECNGLYACDRANEAYELCLEDRGADCETEEADLDGCLDPCDADDAECLAAQVAVHGSSCDPAARRCTLPLRDRPIRPVAYRLSAHFPPYLVRDAFSSVAAWNEVLMRGQRSVLGRTDIDQITARRWATDEVFDDALAAEGGLSERDVSCAFTDGTDCGSQVRALSACADAESGGLTRRCADELAAVEGCVCHADLAGVGRQRCQEDDPTAYCFCGSPEEAAGSCKLGYDPFEPPEQARARGVLNPYDCHVVGPRQDDSGRSQPIARAHDYDDYGAVDYGYRFVGEECMLTLLANSCDSDPTAPCEQLGDLRYQFLTHVQHGAVGFGGVAQPLSDPTSGELIVSNASVAAESLESVGTQAAQLYPVLRGSAPEDSYFTGENVRGYFANLGRVERPVATVNAGPEQGVPVDPSRPPSSHDVVQDLKARMQALEPRMQQLQGQDGRAAIFSDRVRALQGTPLESRLDDALAADADPAAEAGAGTGAGSAVSVLDAPMQAMLDERARKQALAARNIDAVSESLYNSQYHQYWAQAFKGRRGSEASVRMQQGYFRSIMLHEIGHALGLRHNFAASLDRNNYSDGYFQIARRIPLPALDEYDQAERGGDGNGLLSGEEAVRWGEDLRRARLDRLELGAGNTMTSSVMDYSGDLSDFSGLGRYDRAAVLFNYFDRVEAYDSATPTEPPTGTAAEQALSLAGLEHADSHPRVLWSYYRGGDACRQTADCPHAAGRETTAYQPITQRCVTNPRDDGLSVACDGADHCVCSNFFTDLDAYESGDAYRTSGEAREFSPVSYLFCPDNRVNDLSWCTPSDAGESFQESIDHYRLSWGNRYPQTYFRNFKRYGPSRGASDGAVADAVKIYQHLFFRYNNEGAAFQNRIGPLGYTDQLLASVDTLNWLAEIIGMPDVGAYRFDADSHSYRQFSSDPDAAGADLSLPLGQGHYLWSEYQEGLNGFGRLERAGTFLDKMLAIQSIAKRDWGLSFTVDERYYINFYDLFDQEVIDLFGGLVLRNPAAYAPRVDFKASGKATVQYLSTYRTAGRGNMEQTYPTAPIDGTDSEVLRDIAAIEALRTFPIFYDTSFEQRLLVFKLGSGEGYEIPTERADGSATCAWGEAGCDTPDYITYDSDRLHTTYVAVLLDASADAETDEQQLGFQLLRRLSELQQKVRDLRALPAPDAEQQERLVTLREELERDESFVEYLIELERAFGISTFLF